MKPAAQTKLLSTQERSEIMSRAMKTWWANRKAAEAKAERKAKREAKKAAAVRVTSTDPAVPHNRLRPIGSAASGVKVKLPRGTKVEGGKVKLNKSVGRPLPAQYAAKTKRTWRKAG